MLSDDPPLSSAVMNHSWQVIDFLHVRERELERERECEREKRREERKERWTKVENRESDDRK